MVFKIIILRFFLITLCLCAFVPLCLSSYNSALVYFTLWAPEDQALSLSP